MYRPLIFLTLAARCVRPASAGDGGMPVLYRGGFDAASLNRRSSGNASDSDTEIRIMGHLNDLVRRQGCDAGDTVCPGK